MAKWISWLHWCLAQLNTSLIQCREDCLFFPLMWTVFKSWSKTLQNSVYVNIWLSNYFCIIWFKYLQYSTFLWYQTWESWVTLVRGFSLSFYGDNAVLCSMLWWRPWTTENQEWTPVGASRFSLLSPLLFLVISLKLLLLSLGLAIA